MGLAFRVAAKALNSVILCRRTTESGVVWVSSPVKTTKSGFTLNPLTSAKALGKVPAKSGLIRGLLNPQWVSES